MTAMSIVCKNIRLVNCIGQYVQLKNSSPVKIEEFGKFCLFEV